MDKTGSDTGWGEARSRALTTYLELLRSSGNPLAEAGDPVRTQLRAQFLQTMDEAKDRALDPHAAPGAALSAFIGQDRAAAGVHPSQSLAAASLIFTAALPELTSFLASQGIEDPATVAPVKLNAAILRRMAQAASSYVEYLLDKATTAQQDEARRLSRELHDVVGPRIAVTLQGLDLLEHYLTEDPAKAQTKIESSRQSLHDAMTTVRNLAATTRLVIEPGELVPALREHLATLGPAISSAVLHDGADYARLSPHHTNQVFLILRESIRNAARHGSPTQINVALQTTGPTLVATVVDDGIGFDPSPLRTDSTGLSSMRERAALIDAALYITSSPGHTEVRLTVPVPWQEQQ